MTKLGCVGHGEIWKVQVRERERINEPEIKEKFYQQLGGGVLEESIISERHVGFLGGKGEKLGRLIWSQIHCVLC